MTVSADISFAAIDIGTSQIKTGVYTGSATPSFKVKGYRENKVYTGYNDTAEIHYDELKRSVFELLLELAAHLKQVRPGRLYIGICGLVSSYLIWDRTQKQVVNKSFPIWLDRRCNASLDDLFSKLNKGRDIQMLGTHLPKGANWLASKIYHEKETHLKNDQLYLQAGDAIFAELTGACQSHFSSQVSIAHNTNGSYSKPMLDLIQVTEKHLPEISNDGMCKMLPELTAMLGLPAETYVVPALSDFYASFLSIDLKPGEGFILANTSEIAGKINESNEAVNNFVTVSANGNNLIYGSTNTGGNLINWFVRNILGKNTDTDFFAGIKDKINGIHPGQTPVFIPYIDGERAPIWDSNLTGSFFGLRSSHTSAHLYHAVLESIAFSRRYQFEAMPGGIPATIRICGGSTRDNYFNSMRSAVLGCNIQRSAESELAILGTIRHAMNVAQTGTEIISQLYEKIPRNKAQEDLYEAKYRQFVKYQKIILNK